MSKNTITAVRVEKYEATSKKGKAYRVLRIHNAEMPQGDFQHAELCSTKMEGFVKVVKEYGHAQVATILMNFAEGVKYEVDKKTPFSYGMYKKHPLVKFGDDITMGAGKARKLALAMQGGDWPTLYAWLTEAAPSTPTLKVESAPTPTLQVGTPQWLQAEYDWLNAHDATAPGYAKRREAYLSYF